MFDLKPSEIITYKKEENNYQLNPSNIVHIIYPWISNIKPRCKRNELCVYSISKTNFSEKKYNKP